MPTARLPFVDPATGRFPDSYAPPSVNADRLAAESAKADAVQARDEAEGFKDAAGVSAQSAGQSASASGDSATASAGSATAAALSASTALSARDDAALSAAAAQAAKRDAETGSDAAGVARTGAESARDATVAAAGGSELSAQTAANAATASAQSAADAEAAALDVVTRADAGEFKGDPGGLVMGTNIPLGTDLNTLLTPGTYRMLGSSAVNAPTPLDQQWYSLLVLATEGNRVQQILYPSATGQMGRIFYMRATATGAGSFQPEWSEYPATKVDRTAGKAVYTWDSTTRAFALTSGDTGERNVSHLLANGWELLQPAGAMLLQRIGNTVYLRLRNMDPANATNDIFLTGLPIGFRPRSGNNRIPVVAGASTSVTNTWAMARSYERDVRIPRTAGVIGTQYDYIEISWTTREDWPTTLPGTPE